MCLAGEGEDCRIAVRNRSLPPRRLAFVAYEIAELRYRMPRGRWHQIGSSGSGRTEAGDGGCAANVLAYPVLSGGMDATARVHRGS